jgi:hypothetical protein
MKLIKKLEKEIYKKMLTSPNGIDSVVVHPNTWNYLCVEHYKSTILLKDHSFKFKGITIFKDDQMNEDEIMVL